MHTCTHINWSNYLRFEGRKILVSLIWSKPKSSQKLQMKIWRLDRSKRGIDNNIANYKCKQAVLDVPDQFWDPPISCLVISLNTTPSIFWCQEGSWTQVCNLHLMPAWQLPNAQDCVASLLENFECTINCEDQSNWLILWRNDQT